MRKEFYIDVSRPGAGAPEDGGLCPQRGTEHLLQAVFLHQTLSELT